MGWINYYDEQSTASFLQSPIILLEVNAGKEMLVLTQLEWLMT